MFAPLIPSKNHYIIFALFFWKGEKLLMDFAKLHSTDGMGVMVNASCTFVAIKSSSKKQLVLFTLPATGGFQKDIQSSPWAESPVLSCAGFSG